MGTSVIGSNASDSLDGSAPTRETPVLDRDELIELATAPDWFADQASR